MKRLAFLFVLLAAPAAAQQPTLTATFYAAPGTVLCDGLTGATCALAPQADGTWKGAVNGLTVVFNRNPVPGNNPDRLWAISVMDGPLTVGANVSAKATAAPITADFGVSIDVGTALCPKGSPGMGIRVK